MPKTIEQFYAESKKYVELFNRFVDKHILNGSAKGDHICYKCNSKESFELLRAMFETESEYVYQSIISKRRIAYIHLKKGIETSLGVIKYLELSDQKPDNSQENIFDHIEVYPVGQSYEDMVEKLKKFEKVVRIERPHHVTDDIDIGSGFLFRCTRAPLIEKIKNSEMV